MLEFNLLRLLRLTVRTSHLYVQNCTEGKRNTCLFLCWTSNCKSYGPSVTVYCYNCLWLVTVNLLLCLIYKLKLPYIIYIYIGKKHSIYRVGTIYGLRHPPEILECIPCRLAGATVFSKGLISKYIKNLCSSRAKKTNHLIKTGQRIWIFSWRKQRAGKHMKRCSATVIIRELQIKRTMKLSPHILGDVRMSYQKYKN